MRFRRTAALVALAAILAACSQGNSDNVMASQSNSLTPAEVNAALGPETQVVPDNNMLGTDMNGIGDRDTNSPAITESAANNAQ